MQMSLGGGYQFPSFTEHLAWSLGGMITQFQLKNKGIARESDNPKAYQYNFQTKAFDLSAVGRLYYSMAQWRYYTQRK